MNMKRCLSVFVLLAVFFTYTTLDLQAAALQTPVAPHAVSSQDLHQAVQTSALQTNANRKTVQEFLARPGVVAQIQRVGMTPEQVSSRVAMLNDSELLRLNQQIMAMDLQKETAGLSSGAIVAIVLAGVAGLALIIWLEVRAIDDMNSWN